MPGSGLAIFAVFAVLVVIGILVGRHLEQKRREALQRVADELGLSFDPARDPSRRGGRFNTIDVLNQGSNRYSYNHLAGTYRELPLVACDYHYETYSTDSKGRRQTHHHYFGMVFVELDLYMPELRIRREGWFDKLTAAIGFDDIDFESAEFSRRFHVAARDRKFAYDLIHVRAMEYLLEHEGYSWEFEGRVLCLYRSGRFKPELIRPAIEVACGFVPLIPEYVRQDRGLARLADRSNEDRRDG